MDFGDIIYYLIAFVFVVLPLLKRRRKSVGDEVDAESSEPGSGFLNSLMKQLQASIAEQQGNANAFSEAVGGNDTRKNIEFAQKRAVEEAPRVHEEFSMSSEKSASKESGSFMGQTNSYFTYEDPSMSEEGKNVSPMAAKKEEIITAETLYQGQDKPFDLREAILYQTILEPKYIR